MLEILWDRSISLLLFWSIWLLAPLLVDVSAAAKCFMGLFLHEEKNGKAKEKSPDADAMEFYPYVTVVVPVHNSVDTLYQCLNSIFRQNYPKDKLEIVCVNNGSEDNSFEIFQEFQFEHPEMMTTWSSMERAGKSIALNAGIYHGHGTYIMNVDSDTWLDKNAVLRVVEAFEADDSLAAATGLIRVDKEIGEGYSFIDLINYCEIIEYMLAFNIGRRYQQITDSLFTLSGAFSIFRRDALLQSFMYQDRTVSEDTDLTFNIKNDQKKQKRRVGCVLDAVAYVEPINSISQLYAQRLRWQRGEIEAIAIHGEEVRSIWHDLRSYIGRMFISDHTLALIRLNWTFLLIFLYFIGYSMQTVFFSLIILLLCYIILDTASFAMVYKYSPGLYRCEIKKIWWIVFILPFYRYMVYWFRLAGIITVLTEEKSWRVEYPVDQLKEIFRSYKRRLTRASTFLNKNKGGETV
ncbi:MAG: TIGR03111 family XrtG-associated glycosyltransferase [Bacillota bacterium]